jgi:cytochrome c oxidase assembly protein subunit 11
MVGFAFASVPLYRLVCRGLGIGGATQVAQSAPRTVSDVPLTVRFDANIDKQLPWDFKPSQKTVSLTAGETVTIHYHARNLSDHVTVGTATFNVTPEKIGKYFNKIACFCFQEQTLAPGQEAEMAVQFFIDPAMLQDTTTEEVRTVTLSYTFFRSMNGLPIEDDAAVQAPTKLSMAPASAKAN